MANIVVIGATGHIGSYLVPRLVLGYEPRYTTEAALLESLRWLVQNGRVDLGGAELPPPAS